jgi:formylglycine-generating enzyme required for sulfatase activity
MAGEYGVQVDNYTIMSRLGRGGMAEVFLARDEKFSRLVALKVIDASFRDDAQLYKRFDREARTAASFTHPHIVPVHDYGKSADGRPYLSMAFLGGGSLRDVLRKRRLPVDEALGVTRQLASALLAAHVRHVVHRDIKPANVLFEGETAMLTDFGIAKVLDVTQLTANEQNPGTLAYFSPEQALGLPVDQRTDIYALGVVLYEMLTGRRPIEADTSIALTYRVAHEPPDPLPPALRGLQPFMDALLAKDPADRLGSCEDIIKIVDAMLRNWLRYESVDRITEGVVIARSGEQAASSDLDEAGTPGDQTLSLPEPPGGIGGTDDTAGLELTTTRTTPSGRIRVFTEPADARVQLPVLALRYRPGVQVPAGTVRVRVSRDGYRTREIDVEVHAGESHDFEVSLEPVVAGPAPAPADPLTASPRGPADRGPARPAAPWIALGVVALALGAGGLSWLLVPGGDGPAAGRGDVVEAAPQASAVPVVAPSAGAATGVQPATVQPVLVQAPGMQPAPVTGAAGPVVAAALPAGAGAPAAVPVTGAATGSTAVAADATAAGTAVPAGTGTIRVATDPHGARVLLPDLALRYGDGMSLPAGPVHIRVQRDGYITRDVDVDVVAGRENEFEVVLERDRAAFGTLTLVLEPADAIVSLPEVGARYRPGVELPVGDVRVRVEREGFLPHDERLPIVAGGNRHTLALRAAAAPAPPEPPPPRPTRPAGEIFVEPLRAGGEGPRMVVLPAGRFMMGSPEGEAERDADEGPRREVAVASFALAETEVTRAAFAAFVAATGYRTDAERDSEGHIGCYAQQPDGSWGWMADHNWRNPGFTQGDDHPVACVSWNDARAYANWLAAETGQPYRLPSEAEFEYALRAGGITTWPWGAEPGAACASANVADETPLPDGNVFEAHFPCRDGFAFTAPVRSFGTNAFGLADLAGNLWEWTADCYAESYAGAPGDGSARQVPGCTTRAMRGGSWSNSSARLRSSDRDWNGMAIRDDNYGIRVARDL